MMATTLRLARHWSRVAYAYRTAFRQGIFVPAAGAPGARHQLLSIPAWPARSVQTASKAARRKRAVVSVADSAKSSATGAAAAGGPGLAAGVDVDAAIRAACESLGRAPGPAESALVERLQENWYCTALDIAEISDADAASLKLPIRLRSQVALLLRQQQAAAEAATATADLPDQPRGPLSVFTSADSHLLPEVAEVLVSEYLSGHGPLPLPGMAAATASSAGVGSLATATSASSSSGGAAAELDLDSIPIEERRCPPVRRPDNRWNEAPRLRKGQTASPYALKEAELPDALREEFQRFHRFCTVRFFGQQFDPIAPVTAAKYADHMRQFLGWLHRECGHPLASLSFSSGLPSAGREGVSVAFDYLQWLSVERGVSVRTERMALRALLQAAKFLYHDFSKVRVGSGDRAYSDLEVVKELRLLDSAARKLERVAPRVADEALKWLDWPEYLAVVQELRKECAGKDTKGRPRTPVTVAWSLQRYLMFAILSCIPDRQRTLRELEVGRNLFKEKDRWMIRHGPGDYKTGRVYGERPPLVIAPHIYPELEAFIHKWRGELHPTHDFLFSQQNGTPLTQQAVHKVFSTTAYRLTGKKCNPHLVRDSIVTYLRGAGASERELEALAIYMGHSVEMQRGTYDRRTKQQKVEPAVELLESLNRRVVARGGLGATAAGAGGQGEQGPAGR